MQPVEAEEFLRTLSSSRQINVPVGGLEKTGRSCEAHHRARNGLLRDRSSLATVTCRQ
jgi:hypothetical protein